MSAETWALVLQLLIALAVIIGPVVTVILQNVAAKGATRAAALAASEVEKVRKTLLVTTAEVDAKLTDITETGNKVHVLVNNSMSLVLKSNAALARRIADLPGASELDKIAAIAAETASKSHESKQAKVDDNK